MAEIDGASLWQRLLGGEPVESFAQRTEEGRVDFRGIESPAAIVGPERSAGVAQIRDVDLPVLRGKTMRGIDFSGGRLEGVRFYDCRLEECIFDNAVCRDWRL